MDVLTHTKSKPYRTQLPPTGFLEESVTGPLPPRTLRARNTWQRPAIILWIVCIAFFAAVHAWHLRADFPNFSPWEDWSKYTDEGWYGNAAVRAHLFGNWYVPGDFNPAPAVPLWPALEWLLFFVTGVKIEAARGLALAFFCFNLFLSYKLFRERGPRWVGLLAVTLLVTSPFLYCFSRLAILEPLLVALTLGAMNLAIRLPRFRYKEAACALIGLLFTAMLFTKTTAVFLLPALVWMIALPCLHNLRYSWRALTRMLVAAGGAALLSTTLWMALVVNLDLFADFKYFFFINVYPKPHGLERLLSLWWSIRGGLWADIVLIPLAGLLILAALLSRLIAHRRLGEKLNWTSGLWRDPLFSGSVVAAAGYIAFMAYQNHPQPRYYVVVTFFSFFIVIRIIAQLFYQDAAPFTPSLRSLATWPRTRLIGAALLVLVAVSAICNSVWMMKYALSPQYTWVTAARNLTRYIDQHPNGNRLLVSISGDEITLITHLPTLCDDFGTQDLPEKLGRYQPGWYAAWNDLDPGTLEDLHTHFSIEQVAAFPAFDDPDRNILYLFKLHPLPHGQVRIPITAEMQQPLPGDSIDVDVD